MSEKTFETAAECFKSRIRDLAAMHEWISREMKLLNSTYQNGDIATWADAADVGRYRELMMRLLMAMGPLEKKSWKNSWRSSASRRHGAEPGMVIRLLDFIYTAKGDSR